MDRLVVVGGVAAGTTAAAKASRCCPDGRVTLYEQGEHVADVLAVAVSAGMNARDVQNLDLAYAPPYSTAVDVPIISANVMIAEIEGKVCTCSAEGLE